MTELTSETDFSKLYEQLQTALPPLHIAEIEGHNCDFQISRTLLMFPNPPFYKTDPLKVFCSLTLTTCCASFQMAYI